MKIDLIPVKKFIQVNQLQEVNESIIFEKGSVPTSSGLLSTNIFGVSVKDRRENYAYINLNGYFLHPFIFKLLKRMNRNFENIVYGSKKFIINDFGQLIEDENGGTGLNWLYKNWDKINFERNYSSVRNERIDVISAYPKDTLFVQSWIVIPAFYRDVNLQNLGQGKISHHEINDKYAKLIRFASILRNDNNFDFVLNTTRAKVEETLVEIYDLFKGKIEKKQGLIRKSLLGKSIDYGSRSVISAPKFKANKPEDLIVDFYHSGIPLSQCCAMFTPFIVSWIKRFFQREFEKTGNKYPIRLKDGTIKYAKLKDPGLYFNDEYIKKALNRFVHSAGDRFEKIELPIDDPEYDGKIFLSFVGREWDGKSTITESPLIQRPATWTDIFYQAAVDVTSDKMVIITRYPLLDYFGTFPSKITVLSTHQTVPVFINGKVYKNYPSIDLKMDKNKISIFFADTITMSNLYLLGNGGDYDGDQVTAKGLFTQEANQEAEKIMMAKSHILNIYGKNMRTTTNEGVQTLFMMTRFEKSA